MSSVRKPRQIALGQAQAARRRLEDTGEPVAAVACVCGFGTAETMRRTFIRSLGVAPAEYRRRFHAPTAKEPPT